MEILTTFLQQYQNTVPRDMPEDLMCWLLANPARMERVVQTGLENIWMPFDLGDLRLEAIAAFVDLDEASSVGIVLNRANTNNMVIGEREWPIFFERRGELPKKLMPSNLFTKRRNPHYPTGISFLNCDGREWGERWHNATEWWWDKSRVVRLRP